MTASKQKKIILDTNLWISFLIKKDLRKLDSLLIDQKIALVFSKELLEEFITVVQRPKIKRYFTKKDLNELMEIIDEFAVFVDVESKVKKCRDPKDDFLLSLAQDSKADYLITGDKDLLDLKMHKRTKIILLSEFLSII